MARLVDVLQTLGAARQRDGSWSMDLQTLQLGSIFGGDLDGVGVFSVQADAIAFKSPPELAACGKLWLPDVKDDDALCQAIGVAIDDLKQQTRAALATLRRLGFKARIAAPDPYAHGSMQVDGVAVGVVIDGNGDLVVDEVAGRPLPQAQRRSLMAPDEATPNEAQQLVATMARLASVAGGQSLSQEELDELQAALGDDDLGLDDSDEDLPLASDEAEPTMAGVPPPSRKPPAPQPPPSDFEDDDLGTLKMPFNAKEAVQQAAAKARIDSAPKPARAALLDEFDDDDDPLSPPTAAMPMVRKETLATANGRFGGEDAFDGPESTATRPMTGAATAVPPSQRSLLHDEHRQDQDDSDDDLLASLGRDDVPAPGPTSAPAFGDADGGGDQENPFASTPTSVNAGFEDSADLPSAAPTSAYQQPGLMAARDDDDDFDMETTGNARPNRMQATDDDFDDGKTKALVVDEALLARLKAGDFGAPRADPAPPPPAAPAVAGGFDDDDDNDNSNDDDGFEMPPTSAIGDDFDSDATAAPLPGADDDDDDVHAPAAYEVNPGNQAAERDLASMLDEADGFDDGTANMAHQPSPQQPVTAALEDLESEEELYRLEARAEALQSELAAVRQHIQTLRAALEVTGSRTATARTAAAPTAAPTVASPVAYVAADPPRVGDSDDGSAEGDTNAAGEASLLSLQSIDVHELRASTQNSLLDELDDDGDAGADDADDDGGFADAGAAPPVDDDAGGDDLVSLAALQGALKEMGVDLGEAGATQVAASVMPFQLNDDGGDVFGSVSGADSLASQVGERAGGLSEEATRVRVARPSSIALVVEDERARIRLRQHLAERFSELIEADSASAAMRLKGIGDVDAIVFVRPRRDEGNLQSFTRLGTLPHRPRVLVISHDDAFDDIPAVDLRLPLGQRASEVAQQVLDGLERLGIQLTPAA
jgi:hypothetical protein